METRATRIEGGWQVMEVAAGELHPDLRLPAVPAQVPGHVHLDLQRAGVIPDPFARLQERGVAWVDDSDWLYETVFSLDEPPSHDTHLLFHGLDTVAEVALNGEPLGRADNMFVPHEFPVADRLRVGENRLSVLFRSAKRVGLERQRAWEEAGHDSMPREPYRWGAQSFVRKAQYMFGWDWGPVLISCGIWRPVELVTVPVARLGDWRYEVDFEGDRRATVRIEVGVQRASAAGDVPLVLTAAMREAGVEGSAEVPAGVDSAVLTLTMENPRRWSPQGYGTGPVLYELELSLAVGEGRDMVSEIGRGAAGAATEGRATSGGAVAEGDTERRGTASEIGGAGERVDGRRARIGLRTVELVREPDPDGAGEGFLFRVNGENVFCKGANWIPADSFPSRAFDEPGGRLRELLTAARDAGFTMLRVWGGGLYESEHFYNLCDELGILVWQDFPYGCAYYPDEGEYREAARREAVANVRRLRVHPSLALWCGNNENQQMYHDNWAGLSPPRFLGERLYYEVLPETVATEDPRTPYWPGSPYGGENPNSPDVGDRHNWDVWHAHASDGDWPYYRADRARFCSEFGFASSCGLAAWNVCLDPPDRSPTSPAVRWHDKTRKGYETYLGYVHRHFPAAESLEDLVYYSQLNQAEALRCGVEHYRRLKGRCWGTLFWQLNDCWPVQSWAVIDYAGEAKAAYYAAKRFYAPLLLSLVQEHGRVEAYLTSDLAQPVSGEVRLGLLTWDGRSLREAEYAVTLPAGGTMAAGTLDLRDHVGRERELFVWGALVSQDGAVRAEGVILLAEPKDLQLPDPELGVEVRQGGEGCVLGLRCASFAPYVWLAAPELEPLRWEDNFFHLRPGEERSVGVSRSRGRLPVEDLKRHLRVRTLAGGPGAMAYG